jgi:hypothetical protein
VKGAALDPGNMQIATKLRSLKLNLDHHLLDQAKPAPTDDKGSTRYQGLFRTTLRSPDRADLQAIAKARLADYKGSVSEAVQGFVVCANPYADTCLRVYVPRDAKVKAAWPVTGGDAAALKEHQLVTVTGAVVANGKGDNVLLADAVTGEAS